MNNFDFGKQLHVREKKDATPLNKKAMKRVQNDYDGNLMNKPDTGGLWTSTYLGEKMGSAWVAWCVSEEFLGPVFCHSWLMYPSKNARVYTIDSYSDLVRLVDKYPLISPFNIRDVTFGIHLDFEKISKNYDAIHLTFAGNEETHDYFANPHTLNSWDCESTLWFNWTFSRTKYLGKLDFTE